jgi:hypothetical protein
MTAAVGGRIAEPVAGRDVVAISVPLGSAARGLRIAKGWLMLRWRSLSLCLAAALCCAPRVLLASPLLHDATVVTDGVLVRNAEARVFVSVTGARSLSASEPLAGADVELTIAPPAPTKESPGAAFIARGQTAAQPIARGRTSSDGSAVLRFRVPRLQPGPYRLLVATRSPHGASTVERAVEIADELHLHLRTDRAVYRPGQTILWRATALGGAGAGPAGGEEIEVVVRDPRDTAIWRGRQIAPASGMVAGSIPLADDVLTGSYSVTARVRGTEETEPIKVRDFRLPAFEVTIEPRGPGAPAAGEALRFRVTARHRYGEPVRGKVEVAIDGQSPARRGELDALGAFGASLRIPPEAEGTVRLRATVTDGAGRRERAELALPLPGDEGLRLVLVPERQTLARGALHGFTALTVDDRGELVPARVHVRSGRRRLFFDSPGAHRFTLTAPKGQSWKLRATATTSDGEVAQDSREVELDDGPILHLDQAVVAAGVPIVVGGTWKRPRGPLLATLLRGGAPVASTTAVVGPDGQLRAELHPPRGMFGLASVRLIETGWERARRGESRRERHLSVYVRPAVLDVSIEASARHKPGQRAQLAVEVRDAAGRPVPGAALAASVVDERVLALGPPRPDFVQAIRQSDRVEAGTQLGLVFADLLRSADQAARSARQGAAPSEAAASQAAANQAAANQAAASQAAAPVALLRDEAALRAIVEILPPDVHQPAMVIPAEERWQREWDRVQRLRAPALDQLFTAGAIGERDGERWRYRRELWQFLAEAGWSQADRSTPWREPTTWTYAVDVEPELAFDRVAPQVAERRLNALAEQLSRRAGRTRRVLFARGSAGLAELVARRAVASHLAIDPWGTAIHVEARRHVHPFMGRPTVSLVSAGPDLRFGTADDHRFEDVFPPWGTIGVGSYGTVGYGSGSGSAMLEGTSPTVRIGAAETPPVRQRFDETVLWKVGLATDAAGAARLTVPLGDSITGWKVAVEALSAAGAVGAAEAHLETFLPLHLDAELPSRLAVGDRYRIPITVANHSGRARRLAVAAELSGALRRTGPALSRLDLPAGETGVVHVAAEASQAGTGRIHISLLDGSRTVDRVERAITIEPQGELVRAIHTADVASGTGRLAFDVPSGIEPGSLRGRLRLFRGAADVALDGLEGMLKEPHGCFEQTSSTTYPNLLVLRLLRDAPGMAAVRARARALVGRGYQRLLSYEVTGGGFSWFGEEPANQSLTAYGLMEFVDMAAVYPVDPELIARTRSWLIGRQRPDGSWRADAMSMHDWSEVQGALATTAFVAWSLAETGTRGRALDRALAYLRTRRAALARDPYLLGLWAAAESAAHGRSNQALPLLLRASTTEAAGLVFRATGDTLFHARGRTADVQVTALAVTALARADRASEADRALDWLWQARGGTYGWDTTQSTVLALRAAALATPPAPTSGTVQASLDGTNTGNVDLASTDVPALTLPTRLTPGRHELALAGDPSASLRADLRLTWREQGAPTAATAGLAVTLDAPTQLAPHSRATFTATVENRTDDPIAMPTAILPIPPGFTVDPGALSSLRHIRGVSRVEDQGDKLVVYLLDLSPSHRIRLDYRLDAQAECNVLIRPASAYAYYTPDIRGRSGARRISVGPARTAGAAVF